LALDYPFALDFPKRALARPFGGGWGLIRHGRSRFC
jgi:hypothetical protein